MGVGRGDAHGSVNLAGDLAEPGKVVAVVMGDQYGLDILIADGPQQFLWLPWGVDEYAFVGLGAGDQVAVIHHGAHTGNLGYLYLAVIVQCHFASPDVRLELSFPDLLILSEQGFSAG